MSGFNLLTIWETGDEEFSRCLDIEYWGTWEDKVSCSASVCDGHVYSNFIPVLKMVSALSECNMFRLWRVFCHTFDFVASGKVVLVMGVASLSIDESSVRGYVSCE